MCGLASAVPAAHWQADSLCLQAAIQRSMAASGLLATLACQQLTLSHLPTIWPFLLSDPICSWDQGYEPCITDVLVWGSLLQIASACSPDCPLCVQPDTHLQTLGNPQNYTWVSPSEGSIMM